MLLIVVKIRLVVFWLPHLIWLANYFDIQLTPQIERKVAIIQAVFYAAFKLQQHQKYTVNDCCWTFECPFLNPTVLFCNKTNSCNAITLALVSIAPQGCSIQRIKKLHPPSSALLNEQNKYTSWLTHKITVAIGENPQTGATANSASLNVTGNMNGVT